MRLNKGAESVNFKSFRYYDRMLPMQDHLPAGGVGNLIALPLQGQALKDGNSDYKCNSRILQEPLVGVKESCPRNTRKHTKLFIMELSMKTYKESLAFPYSASGQSVLRHYNYNGLIAPIKFVINKPLNIIFVYGFVF